MSLSVQQQQNVITLRINALEEEMLRVQCEMEELKFVSDAMGVNAAEPIEHAQRQYAILIKRHQAAVNFHNRIGQGDKGLSIKEDLSEEEKTKLVDEPVER